MFHYFGGYGYIMVSIAVFELGLNSYNLPKLSLSLSPCFSRRLRRLGDRRGVPLALRYRSAYDTGPA